MADKCLVIGLDGANFDLIKPLAEKGFMPTLAKLMREGLCRVLESIIPPVTGPAWVSFQTGTDPGQHQVFDFVLPRESLSRLSPVTTKDIKVPTLFDILHARGKKYISINLPCSYPPKAGQITITSLMTRGNECVFPSGLREEITELKGYRVVPDVSLITSGNLLAYIKDIRLLEQVRFDCARKLFNKEWDFFFYLISGIDWVQHYLYDKLLCFAQTEVVKEALEFYKDADTYIQWFLNHIPSNTNVIIMSDHGFKVYEGQFQLNEWLWREGYLSIKKRETEKVFIHKFQEEFVKACRSKSIVVPTWLVKNRLLFPVAARLYKRIRRFLPFKPVLEIEPDLSTTKAYNTTPESMGIYINDAGRFTDGIVSDKGEYVELRTEIVSKLKELKDNRGRSVVERIWLKEELYGNPAPRLAPDIIMLPSDYWFGSGFSSEIFEKKALNSHDLFGIFIGWGSKFKEDLFRDSLNITDLMPIILNCMGVSVRGNERKEILASLEVFNEEEQVKNRLKALGYLD
ncbi:alkaline phosphatase family protein [Calderihabitans maritimus]|uniref:Type I phosphodiesterase/nucleotide pyrophosphatase n=1 Tax=Calderihabitans maritimus TaxID=1246530 RepID=A0A1Z5HXQ5_9FIRM|nr:alkaline phosphatase family protein [Calderihabitans maritimus]GAW94060.1 type I phosphodiesterase/nucleotide pyrophosphatase [Calderihabitans maritimus]